MSKKGIAIKCGNCFQRGHNQRTYKALDNPNKKAYKRKKKRQSGQSFMSGAKGNKKLPVNFKYYFFELFILMISLIGVLMYGCILYRVLSNQIWVLNTSGRTRERLRFGGSKNKTIFSSIFCLVIHFLLKRLMGLVYFCFTILLEKCNYWFIGCYFLANNILFVNTHLIFQFMANWDPFKNTNGILMKPLYFCFTILLKNGNYWFIGCYFLANDILFVNTYLIFQFMANWDPFNNTNGAKIFLTHFIERWNFILVLMQEKCLYSFIHNSIFQSLLRTHPQVHINKCSRGLKGLVAITNCLLMLGSDFCSLPQFCYAYWLFRYKKTFVEDQLRWQISVWSVKGSERL